MTSNFLSNEESGERPSREQQKRSMRYRRWRDRVILAVKGVVLGVVAGFGAFMFVHDGLTPDWISTWMIGTALLLTGAFVRLLVPHLKASVAVLLAAFFVGLAVVVGFWISPLWLLEYPVIVRRVLLPGYIGRAIFTTIITFPGMLLVGYLLGMIVDAYAFN